MTAFDIVRHVIELAFFAFAVPGAAAVLVIAIRESRES